MSLPELERLIADVRTDAALNERILAIGGDPVRVTELARQSGYQVDADEVAKRLVLQDGELGDAQLDAIAGAMPQRAFS